VILAVLDAHHILLHMGILAGKFCGTITIFCVCLLFLEDVFLRVFAHLQYV